jgi:AraC family transcriptional regulator of adaptative response/methylated-DNA-[protein]-cysteine methyltransferase
LAPQPIHLLLKGTNFQLQVWRALLDISAGKAASYETIAQSIGSPSASRAVGSAVGANAIGYLIPCHRVIRKSGVVEGYAWGKVRKQAILAWESAGYEQ